MEEYTAAQDRINKRRARLLNGFPVTWRKIAADYQGPDTRERAWLMYSANYLFRSGNIRWAMDPIDLAHRLPDAPRLDVARDLRDLSFVLLTHQHSDHLDLELIDSLRDLPIIWVVPEVLLPILKLRLRPERILVPKILEPFDLHGIRLTAFNGLHWEAEGDTAAPKMRGVPALGYLLQFNGKHWLFPGDTRTYASSQLPHFGPVEGVFAHVWLGRGAALLTEPPLLDSFIRFCLDLQPGRIILTHLNELGREAEELWTPGHAEKIRACFEAAAPGLPVSIGLMGDRIFL